MQFVSKQRKLGHEQIQIISLPTFHFSAGSVVNGVVLGVWGREMQGGKFKVEKVFTPKIHSTQSDAPTQDKEVFISFLSGLELGGETSAWIGWLLIGVI